MCQKLLLADQPVSYEKDQEATDGSPLQWHRGAGTKTRGNRKNTTPAAPRCLHAVLVTAQGLCVCGKVYGMLKLCVCVCYCMLCESVCVCVSVCVCGKVWYVKLLYVKVMCVLLYVM